MRLRFPFALSVLALTLASCSSSEKPEPQAVELKEKKVTTIEAPEAQLLEEGKRLFSEGMYNVARDNFQSLRDSFPLSPYAEFAEIKIADTYFQTREYTDAALQYEDFTKNHPVSGSVGYALLMAGRSNQLLSTAAGRDAAPLEKALDFYNKTLTQFPNSSEAQNASTYKAEAEKSLREHERFVIEYYRKRGAAEAVKIRESAFKQRFGMDLADSANEAQEVAADAVAPTSGGTPGLTLAALASPNLYVPQVAPIVAPVAAEPASARAGVFQASAAPLTPPVTPPDFVTNIECKTSTGHDLTRAIVLYLARPIQESELNLSQNQAQPRSGKIALSLPEASTRNFSQNCFGQSDLRLTGKSLEIDSESPALVMAVNNPPRLLISLP